MKSTFSNSWKKSVQARKQRKYQYNAPLHTQGKFLNANLSSELRKKYQRRSIRVRTGDKVKVQRGSFKGEEQKVEKIDVKLNKVYVEKLEISKKDGSKTKVAFNPSNLMITSLNLDDKKRLQKLQVKNNAKESSKD